MKMSYLTILGLILITACANNQAIEIKFQPENTPTTITPSAEDIYDKLVLCANNKKTAKEAADDLSYGNILIYKTILPTIELYVKQKKYSPRATTSFARYIHSSIKKHISESKKHPLAKKASGFLFFIS